jgi:hypothetical protein
MRIHRAISRPDSAATHQDLTLPASSTSRYCRPATRIVARGKGQADVHDDVIFVECEVNELAVADVIFRSCSRNMYFMIEKVFVCRRPHKIPS